MRSGLPSSTLLRPLNCGRRLLPRGSRAVRISLLTVLVVSGPTSAPAHPAQEANGYLNSFERNEVKAKASVAYYEGGGALLQMARSDDPEVRALYETVSKWVADRQRWLSPHRR